MIGAILIALGVSALAGAIGLCLVAMDRSIERQDGMKAAQMAWVIFTVACVFIAAGTKLS